VVREWRSGSLRERRAGVWEIRVTVATDPVTGRAIQRSFVWHGDQVSAETRCAELAADYADHRVVTQSAAFVTVADILECWLASDHDWRPSSWSSYRSNARALSADPIATDASLSARPGDGAGGDRPLAGERCHRVGAVRPVRTLSASLGWRISSG
jgi:hypothetical protein